MQRSRNNWINVLMNRVRLILHWFEQRRERAINRRLLLEMDDRMLKDMGLCRADIPRLYQRKISVPAYDECEKSVPKDSIVRSQISCESRFVL